MKSKTVAIAFDLNFRHAAEIYSGVVDYVREARLDWQLVPLNFGFEAQLMELAAAGRLDGVIGTFVSDRWISGLSAHQVCAVNLFHFSKIQSIPTVSVDDTKIGIWAARHLSDQGAKRFAFLGAEGLYSTDLRSKAFAEKASEVFFLNRSQNMREQLSRIITPSSPLGIYCTSDRLARYVIRAGLEMGLGFGKDLLVLGTDNEPSESVFAGIGISSITIPAKEIGKEAARRLEERINSTGSTATESLIDPSELVTRTSSLPMGRARIAQRAANFISEYLDDPELDVNRLARETGISRRGLEIAFQAQFQTSPYRYLSQKRLVRAKDLLQESQNSIAEVGRLCGYPESHHFSYWFKKQTSRSPMTYRKFCRA